MKIERINYNKNTGITHLTRIEIDQDRDIDLVQKLRLRGGRLGKIIIKWIKL